MAPQKRPIGFQQIVTLCLEHTPDAAYDGLIPFLVEGDDQDYPWYCDVCGEKLVPREDDDGA